MVHILIQQPGSASYDYGDGGRKRQTVTYVTRHNSLVSDNHCLLLDFYPQLDK